MVLAFISVYIIILSHTIVLDIIIANKIVDIISHFSLSPKLFLVYVVNAAAAIEKEDLKALTEFLSKTIATVIRAELKAIFKTQNASDGESSHTFILLM